MLSIDAELLTPRSFECDDSAANVLEHAPAH
ncbi:MAG: hypothetical protein N838_16365 [Thiohalocapsa sp. PB-PSB1]|nr:MAG: hypothetical protein N838_16365 [Thiohalocapsa sp. PB-PSB1]